MRVLVTGGLGYIGTKLVKALEKGKFKVEVYDRPKDILNIDEVRKAVSGADIVIHLAALAELKYTDAHPEETFSVNVIGTHNIAKACAENKVLLQFTSTCCIYGEPLEIPSMENSQINPTDTYAMSKAAGEYLVKMWGLSQGLKYNIMRFGTVYGQSTDPKMRGDMAIQRFIKAAAEEKEIEITGDGGQNRSFIHIDDLVRGVVLLAKSRVMGETINFAGKERISIKEIADWCVANGADGYKFVSPRKDDFYNQYVSIEKAKKLLGWEPKIPFSMGLEAMYDYYNNFIKDRKVS